jgi:hypothetical protein
MDNIQTALKKLETDRIKNISIINFIKNNEILSVDIINNSVIVKGISDKKWVYISCPDETGLRYLKKQLNADDKNFGAIDDWMVNILTESKKLSWDISTIKFYLPVDTEIPSFENKTVPLTADDAPTVYDNSEYKEYISLEYVAQRITRGISAGIFEDNKLVSWAITQDDGAIGFLHTVAEYRRRGYGNIVTLSLIEELRSREELPFAFVVESNIRSISLLQKLGFLKEDVIHWFEVE